MIPSVRHQLAAVRNTVAKVILPAVDPEDSFALEQTGLVLACLDWALDVQDAEADCALVELADNRGLVRELLEIGADDAEGRAIDLLARTQVAARDLTSLRSDVAALKQVAAECFQALATAGDSPAAWQAMTRAGRRQVERDLSWGRMTGFPPGDPAPISEVLASMR